MIFSRIQKDGQQLDQRAPTGGMVNVRNVTPYFEALRIPIVRGRPFTEEDRNSPEGRIIVDEALASRLYPNEEALGKQIRPGGNGEWFTITGIARNARNAGLFDSNIPEFYVLLRTLGKLLLVPRPEPGATPYVRDRARQPRPSGSFTAHPRRDQPPRPEDAG